MGRGGGGSCVSAMFKVCFVAGWVIWAPCEEREMSVQGGRVG